MSAPAVIIAALNLTPSLCDRLAGEGELLTFADTEPIQALQTILEQRPRLIVLERLFAATPRGAALINRIKTDPQVSQAEIRVMSHTGDYTRVVSRGAAAISEPAVVETAAATAPSVRRGRNDLRGDDRRRQRQRHRDNSTGTARDARRDIASVRAWRFSSMATRRASWTCR